MPVSITQLKSRDDLERKKWRQVDWDGRNQDKEEIPGFEQSMHGCILTYSRLFLKEEHLSAPGLQQNGPQFLILPLHG